MLEIAQLAGVNWAARVWTLGKAKAMKQIAKLAAQRHQCVVAVSGAVDYISDGVQVAAIDNGTPMFPKITGSGCCLARC